MFSRRGFITGLLATPAIVRASSLMAIVPIPLDFSKYPVRIETRYMGLAPMKAEGWSTPFDPFDRGMKSRVLGETLGEKATDLDLGWVGARQYHSDYPCTWDRGKTRVTKGGHRIGKDLDLVVPQTSVKKFTQTQIDKWNELRAHTGMIMVRADV